MGMFLRRGLGEKRIITLSGSLHETLGYVTVYGVKHAAEGTLDLMVGTAIEITVDGESDAAKSSCYVKVDKTTVLQGAGTYQYIVDSAAEIKMTARAANGSSYRRCEITTS